MHGNNLNSSNREEKDNRMAAWCFAMRIHCALNLIRKLRRGLDRGYLTCRETKQTLHVGDRGRLQEAIDASGGAEKIPIIPPR